MNAGLSIEPVRGDSPDILALDEVTTKSQSTTHERWSKLPKSRGRQPRDPHTQTVQFACQTPEDLEVLLGRYLKSPIVPAEHASLEFVFSVSSIFKAYTSDITEKKSASHRDGQQQQCFQSRLGKTMISIADALAPTEESKDRMRKQKAIAKMCVEAIEKADGFRYSFHNSWLGKGDEAYRFSYFCNDSTLNKGRAANEGAGTQGKKMLKPVYDCHGLIAIKFSAAKKNLEVHYKHVPLHKTYAERAPPLRRDSKRKRSLESLNPYSLPAEKRQRALRQSLGTKFVRIQATDLDIGTDDDTVANPASQDTLHPLVHFFGPANDDDACSNDNQNEQSRLDQRRTSVWPQASSGSPLATGSVSREKMDRELNSIRPRKPVIPGTMTGNVRSGMLNWGPRNKDKERSKRVRVTENTDQSSRQVENGAAQANPEKPSDTASIALSELETLKQKLEEAEERIRRLESERAAIPQLSGSPQHTSWPLPLSYPPLSHPHQPPTSVFPGQPLPLVQAQIPTLIPPRPPQLHSTYPIANIQNDQLNTPLTTDSDMAPTSSSTKIQKITNLKPVNPTFLVFTKERPYKPEKTKPQSHTIWWPSQPQPKSRLDNAMTIPETEQDIVVVNNNNSYSGQSRPLNLQREDKPSNGAIEINEL